MMDASQQSQPEPGAVASFEAVLSWVRRDYAAGLKAYERTVTLSSYRAAGIGVVAYIFAFVFLASTRVFFTLATVAMMYGAGVYLYYLMDKYTSRVAAAAAAGDESQTSDKCNADDTQETDPCLLRSLASVVYAAYRVNGSLRTLSGNTLMAAIGLLSVTPILLILFTPVRLLAFVAGLYCLFYPSAVHHEMQKLVEPYIVQFLQMHAGNRAALRSATGQSASAADTEPIADEMVDEMVDDLFKQALVDELESATDRNSDTDEAAPLDGEDEDEDEELIQDSLLGLDTVSHGAEQTSLQQQYAASGADLWDFNRTIDLDAEFAHGLSFSSLTRTSPDDSNSSEVDGRLVASTPDVQTHSPSAKPSAPAPAESVPVASRGEVTASVSSADEQQSVRSAAAASQPAAPLGASSTAACPAGMSAAQQPQAAAAAATTSRRVSPLSVEDSRFSSSSSQETVSQCAAPASPDVSASSASPDVSASSRDDFEVISMEEAAAMPEGSGDDNSPQSAQSTVEQVSSTLAAPATYLKTWLSGEQ